MQKQKWPFQKSSFKSVALKKKFLKTKFDCESFTFQNEKRFQIIFKTNFVWYKQKGGNTLFQKPNWVFKNHFILKPFKKESVLFSTYFKNAPFISKVLSTLELKSFANHPHLIVQAGFENSLSWKVMVFAKCFHQNGFKLRIPTILKHLLSKIPVWKSLENGLNSKTPLQKAQMLLKILSKDLWKAKNFYKSFDFINGKPI